MSEENLKIADILFAYIKGTISECELEELTKWVEAAEEHRELFQQIVTSVSYTHLREYNCSYKSSNIIFFYFIGIVCRRY